MDRIAQVVRTGGVEWHLAHGDLLPVVEEVLVEEGGRRGHFVRPFRGKKVFIKSFSEKGITGFVRNRLAPRGMKEYRAAARLLARSIPTPIPLGYGIGRQRSFVIQEWVEGETVLSLLHDPDRRSAVLEPLAGLLAKLRAHRIRHNDLHLGNILLTGTTLCLIDLHKMVIKKEFHQFDEVSNLAHALLSLYPLLAEQEKERFFKRYGSAGIRGPVEEEMERLAARWIRRKKERALGETSRIVREDRTVRFVESPVIEEGRFVETIKEDRKVRVERWTTHVRKIYRHRRRLERAWKACAVLDYMGLSPIPRVFLMRTASFNAAGYLAMEDLQGRGVELDRYLDGRYGGMTPGERKGLARNLGRFLDGLLAHRISHRDLKGCNLVILEDQRPLLLDIEDIRFNEPKEEALVRMLTQLNCTIPKEVTLRDRLRFFHDATRSVTALRKRILAGIVKASKGREIVYEGTDGLKVERW